MERTQHLAPVPIRPEELLEHAVWLRRLAGSLVRGDADADDLVQDTYLAALRRPPLDDRPVQGWLAEVVRNAGRMRARSAVRRARRESFAIGGEASAPSADVLLGRLSAQRRLSELVAELEEPVRATVLLRYFEGLSAAEIARRQRVPAGTVRWRLKTGLDRLRAELDRESGGDRRRWCALLVPLGNREGGIGTMANGIAKGVWAIGKAAKLMAAAVVALAGLVGLLRFGPWRGGDDAPAQGKAVPAAAARTAKRGAVTLPGPPVLTVPAAQVERDAAAANGAFEGYVVNWSSGKGVAGAEVTFSVDGVTSTTTTDEDGHFDLVPAKAGRSVLAMVTAQGFLPFAPEWGHSSFELFARPGIRVRDITVQLVPALDYTGVVVDPDGKPVAGAAVTLLGAEQGERALNPIQDRFVSDEHGEFHFHAPDDALLEAHHPSFGAARGMMSHAALVSHRLTIKLIAKDGAPILGGEKIAGRVVDPDGNPVAGALVKAHQGHEGGEKIATSGQATTDASGRFAIEGLDPGKHIVVATHAGFSARALDHIAAGASDLLLDLGKSRTLTGQVVESEGGAPLPSFNVLVSRAEGVSETAVANRAVVDAEGHFGIPDLGVGAYRIRATAYGHAPSAPIDVTVPDTPAGPAAIQIRLSHGGKLAGKLVETSDGAPIAGARVSLDGHGDGSSASPTLINALTNERGEFELSGVPAGSQSVVIGAYQHHMRIVSGIRFDEGITTGPLTFDLPRTREGEEPHMELAGIGTKLHAEGDGLKVDSLIPGGGAGEVGIGAGDTILAIDGSQVAQLGMDGSIQRIRGPEGSAVRLTVRKADGTVADVVVTRRRIQT